MVGGSPSAASPTGRATSRLRQRYQQDVVAVLRREFGYRNPMEVPRLRKVVLNIGLGGAAKDAKALEAASRDLGAVTGQRPVLTRAKKSIAAFGRLRKGMAIGAMVTLRGERMYEFLDRLMSLALPRLRDFRPSSSRCPSSFPRSWPKSPAKRSSVGSSKAP